MKTLRACRDSDRIPWLFTERRGTRLYKREYSLCQNCNRKTCPGVIGRTKRKLNHYAGDLPFRFYVGKYLNEEHPPHTDAWPPIAGKPRYHRGQTYLFLSKVFLSKVGSK